MTDAGDAKTQDIQQLQQERVVRLQSEANHCFVCGPSNPIGLGVKFDLHNDVCVAEFTPQPQHMGYDNVTHGGIVFSLLDDVMANWIWLQGEQCFTGKAEIRYRAQLPVGTAVRLEGRCLKRKGRLAQMEGKVIRQSDDFVVAEATGAFMIVVKPDSQ
ncbi:MAG: PaaI family thioesterase [Pseudomonadota bacterium]